MEEEEVVARSEKVLVAVALMVGHGGGIGLISTHSNKIFFGQNLNFEKKRKSEWRVHMYIVE